MWEKLSAPWQAAIEMAWEAYCAGDNSNWRGGGRCQRKYRFTRTQPHHGKDRTQWSGLQ